MYKKYEKKYENNFENKSENKHENKYIYINEDTIPVQWPHTNEESDISYLNFYHAQKLPVLDNAP
jgi:hypothetical protein